MREFKFHTEKEYSPIFGEIWRPYAIVEITSEGEFISYEMLVDSGADITLITKLTGEYIGLKIEENDKFHNFSGVAGEVVPAIIKKVRIKIEDVEFEGRVGWAMTEDVPLLIGRLDILKKFDIEFKEEEGDVIFKLR